MCLVFGLLYKFLLTSLLCFHLFLLFQFALSFLQVHHHLNGLSFVVNFLLIERVQDPSWHAVVQLPLELASLGRFFFSEGLARVQKVDGSFVEDANSLPLRLELGLQQFFSLGNEVRHFYLKLRPYDLRAILIQLRSLIILLLTVVRVNVAIKFADEGLGEIFLGDHLLHRSVLQHLNFIRPADPAAKGENATLVIVSAGRGVRNTQRAIDAVAVFEGWVHILIVAVVAGFTEVCRAEATEEGHTAAKLTLPVDLLTAMLIAFSGARTNLTQKAVLAEKILFLGVLLFSVCHFLLAIDQASEVGLLALVALVERAPMVRELLWFAEVGISWVLKTRFIQNTLLLSILEGHSLDFELQA